MGYNLTNEQIQNTYQQLVQVSGSTLLDGTGSAISVSFPSSSYAVTSSYALVAQTALNAQDTVSSTTFNAYTSSNDASVAAKTPLSTYTPFSASVASQLASIVAGSGSADWDLITNKPSGIVSGSSQTIANLVGQNIVANKIKLTSSGVSLDTISGSFGSIGSITNTTYIQGKSSTTNIDIRLSGGSTRYNQTANSHTFTGNITGSNQKLSGNLSVLGNVTVAGTASIGYLQSVTGSAKVIGDAFIILNNDTPTQPKGGISVVDSGSTYTTSSFLWNGDSNDWVYEYHLGGDHEQAVALFGSGSTIGSPVYPTNNKLQKGTGTHHLHDSIITDNGSQILVGGSVSASAYYGDGSNLTGVQAGLVDGGGAGTSIRSNIGDGNTVSGSKAIGIGGGVTVSATQAIGIGQDSISSGTYGVVLGADAQGTADSVVSIGRLSKATAQSAIAIGKYATGSSTHGIAIGHEAEATSPYSIAIGYGAWNNNRDGNRSNYIAIGRDANSSSDGIAIGYGAKARGSNNIVLGKSSDATANDAITIGNNTSLNDSTRGILIGHNGSLNSGTSDTIAIGYNLSLASNNEINIGNIFTYNSASSGVVSLKGSVETTGQIYSPTFAGSIASATSSIDFDNGNFATLNCASSTFLANPSNLKSGTTYTIIITNGANISGYGTTYKFAGGTAPTLSAGTDVLTMVSDGTSLYATALADFQ